MLKLAHLSDCHIAPLPHVKTTQLLNKRLTGFLNWKRHRQHVHKREVLDALCDDLKQQNTDHIAVTGDLVNLALPDEFYQAKQWLENLGPPDKVSLTLGNHDVYLRLAEAAPGPDLWAPYMRPDTKGVEMMGEAIGLFPYIRVLSDNIIIIALSSGVPTAPFMATGTLGQGQLMALEYMLDRLKDHNFFKILMIHHPPLPGMTKRKRALTDAAQLEPLINNMGTGLVLFGHNHQNILKHVKNAEHSVAVVGVPSASCGKEGREPLARYNMFEINQEANGAWSCKMTGRGFKKEGGQIINIEEKQLFS